MTVSSERAGGTRAIERPCDRKRQLCVIQETERAKHLASLHRQLITLDRSTSLVPLLSASKLDDAVYTSVRTLEASRRTMVALEQPEHVFAREEHACVSADAGEREAVSPRRREVGGSCGALPSQRGGGQVSYESLDEAGGESGRWRRGGVRGRRE